jgi:hypothetical protein
MPIISVFPQPDTLLWHLAFSLFQVMEQLGEIGQRVHNDS